MRILICVLLLSTHELFAKKIVEDEPDAHIYDAGTYLVNEEIPHSLVLGKEVHRKGQAVVTYDGSSEIVKYSYEEEIKPEGKGHSYFHNTTGETRYFVDGHGKIIAQGQSGRYHTKGIVIREGSSITVQSEGISSVQGDIKEVRKIKKTRDGYKFTDYFYNIKNSQWDEYRRVEMIKIK